MSRLAVHFSSQRQDWETPLELFTALDEEYNFDLDVCASRDNAKTPGYFTIAQDGLAQSWGRRICWMNPPYGRQIGRWVQKAYQESQQGATVVCLLPARTDTAWWHDYCLKGEVRFLRGRLTFVGAKHAAPFPSAIVIFKPKKETP